MYIEQAFKVLHEWWRYFVGLIIVILAVIAGQIPFAVAVFMKSYETGESLQGLDNSKVMSLLEPNLNLLLMLLSFAVGLVALLFVAKFLHNQTVVQLTTARSKIDWKRFWFSFFLWGIISSGFIWFDYFMSPEDYILNFKLVPFLILLLIVVIFIPLQTSFEEYLFRGYLMQGIGVVAKNRWVPLLVTSLAFGLLHIANPEVDKLGYSIMIFYIGTGLFLGIMTLMDDGMELSLGFHAANNFFAALLVSADWTALQTHSVLKDISEPSQAILTEMILPVFVVFPILLFIMSKKYGWKNWKNKLFGSILDPEKETLKSIGNHDENTTNL
ncbi:CPBP family intramembrane glutamic endopeptidase [Confluentibacter citreus]|uniref:CPBP family intramembrane glutamic endopeptidase n=1 Tax=Confluentibacter citreus TaxID=2007307 RepID=UPI000C28FC51|nr:CPBP family intramembrane glutamic endopeptidase [Confluentibacter citreus]